MMNKILKLEIGNSYKTTPRKNPYDVLIKLKRYLNTLSSECNDGIDTVFCEEEREVLFKMLDQVEVALADH